MKRKEWFQTTELLEIQGMPTTVGGINYKAKTEGWKKRKAEGIKGRAYEYHIDSLPKDTQLALTSDKTSLESLQEPMTAIPYYDVYASAGHGAISIEGEYSPYSIDIHPQLLLDQGVSTQNLFIMPVKGDSMEPTLFDGEIIVVKREPESPRILEGVYVIRIDNQIFIKRIQYNKFDARLRVDSDNEFYDSYTIRNDDLNAVEILGEAVLTLGRPRKRSSSETKKVTRKLNT